MNKTKGWPSYLFPKALGMISCGHVEEMGNRGLCEQYWGQRSGLRKPWERWVTGGCPRHLNAQTTGQEKCMNKIFANAENTCLTFTVVRPEG